MSETVAQKVVELRFEAEQFEAGVKSALNTIKMLKSTLNELSGFKASISEVGKSISDGVKGADMAPLQNGVDQTQSKFSVLEEIATGALRRIGEQAVNMGEKLVSSMTIDQMSAGWDKYAEKTSSVQRIMSSTADQFTDTGEQMKYVEEQMQKLNWFTDETSYNFVDMVGNIGKFTANQIKLDDAVTAMEGISTWAAKSGANVNEAGRAMYNLSQAIGVGSVKLMDWKSIENANMATAEFKQQAIDTAVKMGTLKDLGNGTYEVIKKSADAATKSAKKAKKATSDNTVSVKDFNSQLAKGWFTSEVLVEVLKKYGNTTDYLYDVTTRYDTTASKLLADLNDYEKGTLDANKAAKEYGTTVEDLKATFDTLESEQYTFGLKAFRMAQEAKTFQEAIDATYDATSTAWMNVFQNIFGNYEQAKVVWTDLANNLWDIFAAAPSGLNDILSEAQELSPSFGEEFLSAWNGMWDGIMDRVYAFQEAFTSVFNLTAEGVRDLASAMNEYFNGAWQVGDYDALVTNISNGLTIIKETLVTIGSAIKMVSSWFSNAFKGILDGLALGAKFQNATDFIVQLEHALQNLFSKLTLTGNAAQEVQAIFSSLGRVFGAIGNMIGSLIDNTYGKLSKGFGSSLSDSFTKFFSVLGDGVSKFINFVTKFNWLTQTIEALGNVLGKVLQFIGGLVNDIVSTISSNFNVVDIVVLSFAGVFKKLFDELERADELMDGIEKAFTKIPTVITNVFGAMAGALDAWSTKINVDWIREFGFAMLMLASALLILSSIDVEHLVTALSALYFTMKMMVKTTKGIAGVINNVKNSIPILGDFRKIMFAIQFTTLAVGMAVFAGALILLAAACKIFSTMDWNGLAKGLVGAAVGMELMVFVLKQMAALYSTLGGWKGFGKGREISGITKMIRAMIPMAIALVAFAVAAKIFSTMDWNALARGMTGAVGALTAMSLALFAMSKMKIGIRQALAMQMMAAVMLEFVGVIAAMTILVAIMGNMQYETLKQGFISLSIIIGLMLGTMELMTLIGKQKGSIAGAGAFATIAGSLATVAYSLKMLGKMDFTSLATSVGALVICIAAIVGAMKLMSGMEHLAKSTSAFSVISFDLILIAYSINMLAKYDWQNIAVSTGAMVVALGAVVGAIALLGAIKNVNWSGVLAVTVLAVAMGALAIALQGWASLGIEAIIASVVGLAVALGVLIGAAAAISALSGIFLTAAAALGAFGAACALVMISFVGFAYGVKLMVDAIKELSTMTLDGKKIAENLKAVGEALEDKSWIKSVTAAMIETFDDMFSQIITKIPHFIAELGEQLIATMGQLIKYVPLLAVQLVVLIEEVLRQVAAELPNLGGAFGELLKGMLAGFQNAFSSLTPDQFMTLLMSLQILNLVVTELALMAAMMPLAIVGAGEMIIVAGLLGKATASFTKNLGNLKNFDANKVKGAAEAIKAIAEASAMLKNVKMSKLDDFDKNIAVLGRAMKSFGTSVKGLDPSAMKTATAAFKAIVEINNMMPKNGSGFMKWLAGEKDLGEYSQKLSQLGRALGQFSTSVQGMDPNQVGIGLEALKKIVEINNHMPKNGSTFAKWFGGEKDIGQFGKNLTELGRGLSSFCRSINLTDFSNFDTGINAVKQLTQINVGELPDFFFNDYDTSNLTEQFGDIFDALATLSSKSTKIDDTVITNFVKSVQSLEKIKLDKLPDFENSDIANDIEAGSWSESFQALGEAVSEAAKTATGLDTSNVKGIQNVAKIIDTLSKLKIKETDGFPKFDDLGIKWDKWSKGFAEAKSALADAMVSSNFTTENPNVDGIKGICKIIEELSKVKLKDGGDLPRFDKFGDIERGGNGIDLEKWAKGFLDIKKALHSIINTRYGFDENGIGDISQISSVADALKTISKIKLVGSGGLPRFDQFGTDVRSNGIDIEKWKKGFLDLKKALVSITNTEYGFSSTSEDGGVSGIENMVNTINQLSSIPPLEGDASTFPHFEKFKDFEWEEWKQGVVDLRSALNAVILQSNLITSGDAVTGIQNLVTVINELCTLDMDPDTTSFPSFKSTDFGVDSWEDWQDNMLQCAAAISLDSESGAAIDSGGVIALCDALNQLSTVKPDELPDFSAINGLDTMGQDLGKLKEAITEVSGFTADVSGICNAVTTLAALCDTVPTDSGKLVTFGNNLKSLKESLSTLDGFTADTSGLSNAVNQAATNALAKVGEFTNTGTSLGQALGNGISKGIVSAMGAIGGSVANVLNTAKSILMAGKSQWYSVGADLSQGLANGILSKKSAVVAAAEDVANAANSKLRSSTQVNSPSKLWAHVGGELDEGLVLGMESGKRDVANTAGKVGDAATDTLKSNLGVHSPSEVWKAVARYCTEGFAIGLRDGLQATVDSVKEYSDIVNEVLAKTTFDDIEKTINKYKNLGMLSVEAEAAIYNKLSELDPAKSISMLGKDPGEDGLKQATEKIQGYGEKYFSLITGLFDKRLDEMEKYGEATPAKILELMWGKLSQYEVGTREYIEYLHECDDKLFEYEEKNIERAKKYGTMTAEQEIDYWQQRLLAYEPGSTKYNEIVDKIYDLENDKFQNELDFIKDAGYDAGDAEFNYWMKRIEGMEKGSDAWMETRKKISAAIDNELGESDAWIQNEKDYGRLGMTQELDALYREKRLVIERDKAAGIDYRNDKRYLDIEKKIYTLTVDINNERKDHNKTLKDYKKEYKETIRAIKNENYTGLLDTQEKFLDKLSDKQKELLDKLKQSAKSYQDYFGIFGEVTNNWAQVDLSKMYFNLNDQTDIMTNYADMLDSLNKRIGDTTMMEELRQMGLDGYNYVEALYHATDADMNMLLDAWKSREDITKRLAYAGTSKKDIDDAKKDNAKAAEDAAKAYRKKVLEANDEFNKKMFIDPVKWGEDAAMAFMHAAEIMEDNGMPGFGYWINGDHMTSERLSGPIAQIDASVSAAVERGFANLSATALQPILTTIVQAAIATGTASQSMVEATVDKLNTLDYDGLDLSGVSTVEDLDKFSSALYDSIPDIYGAKVKFSSPVIVNNDSVIGDIIAKAVIDGINNGTLAENLDNAVVAIQDQANSFRRMGMYVDGKTLAGAISDHVNWNIGRMAKVGTSYETSTSYVE